MELDEDQIFTDRITESCLVRRPYLHTYTTVSTPASIFPLTGNELADLLPLGGLDGVVLVLVVPEVQGEHVGRGGPSPDGGQRPRLEDLFGLLVQPEDRVLRNAQETRHELVPLAKFLLIEEKRKKNVQHSKFFRKD